MNRQLSSIPSTFLFLYLFFKFIFIVDDPQGPVWTYGSPRRQPNLEVERLWFGVASNTEVPWSSVRWMVTLIVPNINRFLPPSTFPTTRGVRFFNRMELLAIPQVPQWQFLRGKKIKVLSGMASTWSPDMNIIEHIWGRMKEEAWRTKPKNEGGALGCLQGGLPCHPRRLHQQTLRLSAKPDGNCSAGQRNPYKILIT